MSELKAIQLDSLLDELDRIKNQQVALQDAISNDKAIVIHPRREVRKQVEGLLSQVLLEISDTSYTDHSFPCGSSRP